MPGKPPRNANNSLGLSRLLKIHTQILLLGQSPDISNTSLCLGWLTTIPTFFYAGEVSQQFQHFLTLFKAFEASHANPYACTGSQQFRQFLTPVQAFNASHANPYASARFKRFTPKSLCRCML
ncbi:hypothetical protein O181_122755 [Austropuccinia psidii MF-1]|uniref:Uncharacterized protein n=1 Tax=Austropuccinia psidii MF-1 TaxID=1389203 RepID=A0A9Q3Q3K9_9BASI|nr:hypothetical protein [Austropuccinia psidii MF-1]